MRRSTLVLLLAGLLTLLVIGAFLAYPEGGRRVLVELELVAPSESGYLASGLMEARKYVLGAEAPGRVVRILAQAGERVRRGGAVVQMDTELLEAEREVAKARYAAAEASHRMLQEGAREEELAVARAAVELARTAWEGALQAVDDARAEGPDATRDARVELAAARAAEAEADLAAARAALQALESGPRAPERAAADAALRAAWADLEAIDAQIARQELQAPVDGVVQEILLRPGELALPGQPVAVVADLSVLTLTVYIPEADLHWVALEKPVEVKVDAYPDRSFTGKVTWISDRAEYTPRNVQTPEDRVILVYAVQIQVPNPEGALKPGLPADAVFEAEP